MSKYTPGPFAVETRYHVHAIVCKPTRPGEFPEVAFIDVHGHENHGNITARKRTDEELLANARLFAAAPDLFALAEKVERYILSLPPAFQDTEAVPRACLLSDARAAIVKATGEMAESNTPPLTADVEDASEEYDEHGKRLPNGCAECARSFGPHYRGPCHH